MSKPRQILPGKSYLITRRCIQRQFLLRPSAVVNRVFLFCLAYASSKYKIDVHAAVALSNHCHLVITDTEGRLPKFMQWLDLYVSKCMNVVLGRWGAFWEPESYSGVQLIEDHDVLEKMLYTLVNPVEAGLVRWGDEWPGFRSKPEDVGVREFVAKRPDFYFSPKGTVPEEVRLTFVKPKLFEQLSDAEFRKLLGEKYRARERAIQDKFDAEKRRFLGASKVKKKDPFDSPSSYEEKRKLNPRIACKRKWPRIAAIESLQRFVSQYREALARYRAGDSTAIFPAGTYWLRVQFGVRCHAPP